MRAASQYWAHTALGQFRSRYWRRYRRCGITDIATKFPPQQQKLQRILLPQCFSIDSSLKYWSRILKGSRTIRDTDLIKRVECALPDTAAQLAHPVWDILQNPLASQKALDVIKQKFHSSPLADKAFTILGDHSIKYRKLFNGYEGQVSTNTLDMLALRLVAFREQKISGAAPSPQCDLAETLLLFLRLATLTELKHVADKTLRAIYIFFIVNENESLLDECIMNTLTAEKSDHCIRDLFQTIAPGNCNLPEHTLSVKNYLEYNKKLLSSETMAFPAVKSGENKDRLEINHCTNNMRMNILFSVDRFYKSWLTDTQKIYFLTDLFHSHEVWKYMHSHPHERIW